MIELYAHPSQNVLKVLIALEETGLSYRVVNDRTLVEGSAEHDAYIQASPTGQVPAILDAETGAMLFESAAILIYLAEKSGRFLPGPTQPAQRAEVLKWLMFEAANLTPAMLDIYHYTLQAETPQPYCEERARTRTRRVLDVLENILTQPGRPYIAGASYSIADMILYPWLPILEDFTDISLNDYPALTALSLRIGTREAVKRAEGA